MNNDSNLINNIIKFMDTYDKFKQYTFKPEPNQWVKIGSFKFPDAVGNYYIKLEIIYGDIIQDIYQGNNIVIYFKTEFNNIKYNKYNKFYGQSFAYEYNNNTNLNDINIIQVDNNKYDLWILFSSYYSNCLIHYYGNYTFDHLFKTYDTIDTNFPTMKINRHLIINKEYIDTNFYTKNDIENMIGSNNYNSLEEVYVKKTELDNRLLNLMLKSNNLDTPELLTIINGSLNNYYVKIDELKKYQLKNLTYDIGTLNNKFNQKADKNDLVNIVLKSDLSELINSYKVNNTTNNYLKLDNYYDISYMNILLSEKANSKNIYTKTEIDNIVNKKSDKYDIYIKPETYNRNELNELLNRKSNSYNGILDHPTITNPTFYGEIIGINKFNIGLDNVNNTSDLEKPTSYHTLELLKHKATINDLNQKADKILIDIKAPINNPIFTGIVKGITKEMVNLGNVDNTSDSNKPISTQVQLVLNKKANIQDLDQKADNTELDKKASLDNPTFTGIVKGITKHMIGLCNVDNTSDENKQMSKIVREQLNLKVNITDIKRFAPLFNPEFTGIVSGITKDMIGLGNVDNTPDYNKPLSQTIISELNKKAPLNNPIFTGTVTGITKDMIGLNNINNTADIDKPIAISVKNELLLKAPIDNPSFTGIVNGLTKNMVGLNNVDNTSDINKPISIQTQNILNSKLDQTNPLITGLLKCNNLSIYDSNNSYIKTSNNLLLIGTNNNDNLQINLNGQITQLNSNSNNDFCVKLCNLSNNNGFGLLIDQNDTPYSLCIKDKQSKIRANIGGNGAVSIGGNGNALNILSNGFVGINTTTPTYNLEINGTTYCSSGVWSGSDERLKKNIINADTTEVLQKINKIKLKEYDYIDKQMGNSEYGVIAQQIKKIFPESVKIMSKIIPSIMKYSDEFTVDMFNNGIIKLNTNNFKIDTIIREQNESQIIRICANDIYDDVEILTIYDNIIKVKINNLLFKHVNKVFIYGHQINDFHSLDKTSLLIPLIGAIQELYKLIQT